MNWPDFLFSSTHGVFLVKNNGRDIDRIASVPGLYYGITWDALGHIYMAHRTTQDELSDKNDSLIIYRPDQVEPHSINVRDVHQIHFDQNTNRVYVTDTGRNRIMVWPNNYLNWQPTGEDLNHINSIWIKNNLLYALEHNKPSGKDGKPSRGVVYNLRNHKLEYTIDFVGEESHNICEIDQKYYICDSKNESLIVIDKLSRRLRDERTTKKLAGWTRGLAINDNVILVGSSVVTTKEERINGDSEVFMLNRETCEVIDTLQFPSTGQINEVRIVNDIDYAHNEIILEL